MAAPMRAGITPSKRAVCTRIVGSLALLTPGGVNTVDKKCSIRIGRGAGGVIVTPCCEGTNLHLPGPGDKPHERTPRHRRTGARSCRSCTSSFPLWTSWTLLQASAGGSRCARELPYSLRASTSSTIVPSRREQPQPAAGSAGGVRRATQAGVVGADHGLDAVEHSFL